jgi:hypothetical protein
MNQINFAPRLDRDEAHLLSKQYRDDDTIPEAAGERIRRGSYDRENLNQIFDWKTKGRGRSRLNKNDDAEIREALKIAATAERPRTAMAVLVGLAGVDVPVASAILAMVHPDDYTVIDFRALESLNYTGNYYSIPFYLDYREFCIRLARKWNMSLRDLDRALWQWSKNQNARPERMPRRAG